MEAGTSCDDAKLRIGIQNDKVFSLQATQQASSFYKTRDNTLSCYL